MITQLRDGRFRVSVRCADHVTRWRICAYEGTAKFYEAIFLAGWYDDDASRLAQALYVVLQGFSCTLVCLRSLCARSVGCLVWA